MKKISILILICLSALNSAKLSAQSIAVSNAPSANKVCSSAMTRSYYVAGLSGSWSYMWYITGGSGTINGSSSGSTVSVTWSGTSGSLMAACTASGSSYPSYTPSQSWSLLGTPSVTISGPSSVCSTNLSGSFTSSLFNGDGTLTYQWYKNGSPVGNQTSLNNITLANGDAIYLTVNSTGWCGASTITSNTYTTSVTTTTTPDLTLTPNKVKFCTGDQVILTASSSYANAGTTYQWRVAGVLLTGPNSNTWQGSVWAGGGTAPPAGTYFGDGVTVQVTASGFSGNCVYQSVSTQYTGSGGGNINPPPNPPSGGDHSICGPGSVPLSVTVPSGSVAEWYSGATLVNTGLNYSPSLGEGASASYTVKSYDASTTCRSTTTAVTARSRSNPVPTITKAASCGPGTATLDGYATAAGASTTGVYWYEASSGGSLYGIAPATKAITGNITMYATGVATYSDISCESPARTAVPVVMNTVPALPTPVVSNVVYSDGVVNMSGTPPGGLTVNWYNNPSDVSSFRPAQSTYSPTLTATTSFYITSYNSTTGCESAKQIITGYVKNLNSIATYSLIAPNITSIPAVSGLTVDQASKVTTYFDGLGREMQTISKQGSPARYDLTAPVTYDALGREGRKYLPFAAQQNGTFKPMDKIIDGSGNYADIALNFYANATDNIADDAKPYSQVVYEASPLSRALKQGSSGTSWQPDGTNSYSSTDHTIKHAYETNGANEVLLWTYSYPTTANPLGLVNTGTGSTPAYYAANTLVRNRTRDENGNEVIEYVNPEGKTVLKRVQFVAGSVAINDTNYASTYYIYDDFLNLVCVIQPEGTTKLSTEYYQAGATNATKEAFLKRWAFKYKYDSRKRMVLKQVPGADSVRMVYDKLDRLVFTQDGNQRSSNKWSYSEYDVLNRPIISGIYTHGSALTQAGMTALVNGITTNYETYNGTGSTHGYTTNVFPTASFPSAGFEVLTVTYYDSYAFKTMIGDTQFDFVNNDYADQYSAYNQNVKGHATGSKTKVLDQVSPTYLWSVGYLDNKYRGIQSIATNAKGGVDRSTMVYDFPGKVLKTMTTHKVGAVVHTTARRFEYDHMGRVLRIWHKLDNMSELVLAQNDYNELGQLVKKKLHAQTDPQINQAGVLYNPGNLVLTTYTGQKKAIAGGTVTLSPGFDTGVGATFQARVEYSSANPPPGGLNYSFAQVIDYRYNIRGWLTKINDSNLTDISGDPKDFFGMELGYDTDIGTAGSAAYNGNISAATWSTNYMGAATIKQRAYNYSYDPMNRITGAAHKEKASSWSAATSFGESGYTYDLNGNIKGLTRNGVAGTSLDVLSYDYGTTTSNQLLKVSDTGDKKKGFIEPTSTSGNDYTYDANGSMTVDQNKGITAIAYNHLNLPKQVTKSTNDYVKYVYDAGGRKIRQEVYNPSNVLQKKTEYDGKYIYENDTLKFINTEEGRVVMTGATPEYQYQIKDHLGNIRTMFTTKQSKDVYTATFEDNTQAVEVAQFQHYSRVTNDLYDHTDAGTVYDKVQILTGGNNSQVGLAKSLSVMAGDTVTAEVFAKYFGTTGGTSNLAGFATALLSAFGVSAPVGGETFTASSALNSFGAGIAGGTIPQNNPSWPSGWLNILVFDKNYALVDAAYQQLDGTYVQTGATKMPHQQLSKTVYIKEAGYVYIYVSNEGSVVQDIYFDDMKVTHSKSPIIQQEDYYAFGLAFNEYQRTNSVSNKYKFNGVENPSDLQLDLYQTAFRSYDAATGRFFQNDPLANFVPSISPYQFGFNNPIRFSDPLGLMGEDEKDKKGADGKTNEEWVGASRPEGMTASEQESASDRRQAEQNSGTRVNGQNGKWKPFGTRVYSNGKLINETIEGYYFFASESSSGINSEYPYGQFTDPSSLRIKKVGLAWVGSAHYTEKIKYDDARTFRTRTINPNITIDFMFRADDKKQLTQYLLAGVFDEARLALLEELIGNPNMTSQEANASFKIWFQIFLLARFTSPSNEAVGFKFQNINTFEVKFSVIPPIRPFWEK